MTQDASTTSAIPAASQATNAAGAPEIADDSRRTIRRALISTYDKSGLVKVAAALTGAGVEIVSTGSTAAAIVDAGMPVRQVSDITGFSEFLDGRVKTLHPAIHAGLLADQESGEHRRQLADLELQPFDLVVSNLYPFAEAVASGAGPRECIEQIDIGGPAMVRAAAKNHRSVAVITSPHQYDQLATALATGGFTLAQRQQLAARAFTHTATYDVAVASWMSNVVTDSSDGTGYPAWMGATWNRADVLRYGENPHQRAALYETGDHSGGLAAARQLHGKQMSYNNYTDTEAALRAAADFDEPTVAVVKHANPCGIATGSDIAEAHRKAHACDPQSAFGGVIATNQPVPPALAEQVAPIFTEVLAAPGFDPGAVEILQRKKNIRLLITEPPTREGVETKAISGGLLVQDRDVTDRDHDRAENWQLACGQSVDEATLADLEFAWKAIRSVKSNAILLASDRASVGIGMGQVNRVDAAWLAVQRAGERASGAVAASDAFFPFPDGLEILAEAGIRAVVQPGGSVRDDQVIQAAAAAGMTLYHTGARHFLH
jgi:phosphoribosylaminoimidazolecarboxamide formyltransferase/IMP cyclohydrolase